MADHPRFGDFGFQTVVDTYQPSIADMDPVAERFGLQCQVQYLYGGLTTTDGDMYVVERKLIGPMTSGVWLMTDRSGDLELVPRALDSARGETRRDFTRDHRRWTNHLMHEVGQKLKPSDDQPLFIEMTDDRLTWDEGELFRIEGDLLGPGFQYYMPMRESPLFYTTQFYRMSGEFFGQQVEGFVGIDHGYWTPGTEWKEYTVFRELELAWEVFANRYGDDVEWGVIVKGRQGLSAAIVFENGEPVARTDDMPTRAVVTDDHQYVETIDFEIDDATYRFTASETGKMLHFNQARWGGYTSQGGITQRVDDDRRPDLSFCWIETFPGRLVEDGLTKD